MNSFCAIASCECLYLFVLLHIASCERLYLFVLLQILAYIVTFLVVLGGAVFAKASLLLMTSQLEPERKVPFCNRKYGKVLRTKINNDEFLSLNVPHVNLL